MMLLLVSSFEQYWIQVLENEIARIEARYQFSHDYVLTWGP